MKPRISSPDRYRYEDRFLFIVVPLIFLDGILGFWGFHYHHLHVTGVLAYICAFLASLPILSFIVINGLYLAEEKDEFQRTLFVRSMLWGIGATLAVTTFWGSLEKFAQVPSMDIASVQFLFLLVMIVAQCADYWRYR
jgi:hypothetical protein